MAEVENSDNPMNAALPREGICGAKTRDGTPCQKAPMPNGRCRLHGGLSPGGVAAGRYKHGWLSKYLPKNLRKIHRELATDPEWLSVQEEILTLTTREVDLLQKLESSPPVPWAELNGVCEELLTTPDDAERSSLLQQLNSLIERGALASSTWRRTWQELREIFLEKARLVQVESKRLSDLNAQVSVEQVILLFRAFLEVAREVITDRKMLREFVARTSVLLPPEE